MSSRTPPTGAPHSRSRDVDGTSLDISFGYNDFLTVGDFDADGRVDLLARLDGSADVFRNLGPRHFERLETFRPDAPNGNKGGVLLCDFDGDGDLDIFWADGGTENGRGVRVNQVFLHEDYDFLPTNEPDLAPDIGANGADCGDVDHDGDLDLVVAHGRGVTLFRNTSGPGGTLRFEEAEIFSTQGTARAARLGDVDGDLDLDLFVSVDGPDALWLNDTDDRNALLVRVRVQVGDGIYRDDVGARIRLFYGPQDPASPLLEMNGGRGYGSMGTSPVHLGLPAGPFRAYFLWIDFQHPEALDAWRLVTPADLGPAQWLDVDSSDGDGDGIESALEQQDGGDEHDLDGDGLPDWSDDDTDGDGVPDRVEGRVDTDGDGRFDYRDPDSDGDGFPDRDDGCRTTVDLEARDLDGDGLWDACDPDRDGDGIENGQDVCPDHANPDQDRAACTPPEVTLTWELPPHAFVGQVLRIPLQLRTGAEVRIRDLRLEVTGEGVEALRLDGPGATALPGARVRFGLPDRDPQTQWTGELLLRVTSGGELTPVAGLSFLVPDDPRRYEVRTPSARLRAELGMVGCSTSGRGGTPGGLGLILLALLLLRRRPR
ncbi:MAG: hypothetical protein D6729_11215 [Deltaproteobacteria bacterium]|nr:MAG: hypothetical protein D6729_11215 [Deltaproteobacteria bacterium]